MQTGLYGLDPKLVALGFFAELLQFAVEPHPHQFSVWLAIPKRPLFDQTIEAGITAWLGHLPVIPQWERLAIGVPYLDHYEEAVLGRVRHPQWAAAWLHLRYTELVLGYIFFVLAANSSTRPMPEKMIKSGRGLTFGAVKDLACKLAAGNESGKANGWPSFFADLVRNEDILKLLNTARNDIAHGRAARSAEAVRGDMERFLRPKRWQEGLELWGPPPQHVEPWTAFREEAVGEGKLMPTDMAVFEEWREEPHTRWYLVPWNGSRFSVQIGG